MTAAISADRRARLRWRARRGLLENDLVLTRFLDRRLDQLDEADINGLDLLLDLSDNELLDLILARKELVELSGSAANDADAQRVLGWLRSA